LHINVDFSAGTKSLWRLSFFWKGKRRNCRLEAVERFARKKYNAPQADGDFFPKLFGGWKNTINGL
jgi:hypothetical protein